MQRRTLEELNLLDDFLFGSVISYPEIGEKFSRELLKIIFCREIGRLRVVPQKVYYGSDTGKHGARLDVYLEEDEISEQMTAYDIEPNQYDNRNSKETIPRRVRFYHAKIDAGSLKSGESYQALRKVIVVMIMPYDPFGLSRMVYTIKNMCEEEPAMCYDDGARTLFLYTKGTEGNPSKELQQLLYYMEDTREENAVTESLKDIHRMVEIVKRDREVELGYMKIFEREEMLIEQGREEERRNTEKERKNVEKERQRANDAEKEVERLKEEIKKLKS